MTILPVVYKYRPISSQTETLLRKREIYFPLASEINDPFDCRVVLNREAPPETLWEMMKTYYATKYSVADEIDIVNKMLLEFSPSDPVKTRTLAKEIIDQKKWMTLLDHIEAGNQYMLKGRLTKTRLYCFSAVRDSLLMWSHYADYHSGICLGFSTESPVLSIIKPVEYLSEYPKISSYTVDDDTYLRFSLYSKAKDWSYEQEWRIVLNNADKVEMPVHHFASTDLKEVIFGCQCKQIDRLRVQQWLTAGALSPDLYEAVPFRNEFKLDIRQLGAGA